MMEGTLEVEVPSKIQIILVGDPIQQNSNLGYYEQTPDRKTR
jgi:hypothetical protein